jgi:xanthine dehydrogenase accessory factor
VTSASDYITFGGRDHHDLPGLSVTGSGIVKQETLDRLLEARAAKRPSAVLRWLGSEREALVVDGQVVLGEVPELVLDAIADAFRRDKGTTVRTANGPLFIQVFNPPLRLMVVGAVHIAQALVPIASVVGYDVTVIDPRRAFASDARFPGVNVRQDWPDEALEELRPDARTALVTLTHDPKLDDPALDVALRSDAFYIAALGSRRTHAARLERLKALGHDAATMGRIHGPAGLSLGAVSPAEIAIAVMAEMTRTLRQPAGREPTSDQAS